MKPQQQTNASKTVRVHMYIKLRTRCCGTVKMEGSQQGNR